ncbi:sensor histidine kinase [Pseudonocardia acaciae]|uniref:sensor histidine kinase n=1 Tax=Pseudonocardia acaciae TaxID=551276 RepID=UPI001B7FF23D|nr:histidine kinase [Pseudonocardia acaciae]
MRRYTWWSLLATTAFLLIFVVGRWLLRPGPPVVARVAASVALAVTVVACAVVLARRLAEAPGDTPDAGVAPGAADVGHERAPIAWLAAGSVAAAALGGFLLAARNYELWSVPPATMVSVAVTFLPARRRWALVTAAILGAGALGGIMASGSGSAGYAAAFSAGMVALVVWVMVGMLWSWDVAERLNQARRLSAQLAVKDERLRFAADLHDIQGHHLQVIALKSELAARLARTDPDRAGAEMSEVRRLAADALRDTRAVVQGYRRTTLDEEMANAAKVLTAADITARMDVDPAAADLPDPGRHLLGLVMREATTNVLRHSRARHAELDYRVTDGLARLRISNDGTAGPPPEPAEGTGLRTLADRLTAAGGQLSWKQTDGRFVLTASLPVTVTAPAHAHPESPRPR